jgi:hypothetical protein
MRTVNTRAIQKVTSSVLLTEKAVRKKNVIIYKKNTYILKLLLKVVTTRIEVLVALGNKTLYACVKEVCRL